MPLWDGFVGPSNRARSATIASDQAINIFLETTTITEEIKLKTFYGTPGMKFFMTLDTLGCRGIFEQDNRCWAVFGDTLYELNIAAKTSSVLGTVPNDGLPVSFSCNGRGGEQMVCLASGSLFVFNLISNTLSAAIVLPLTNAPVYVDFIDGYFLLLEAATVRVWFSNLEDGTTWDALDFFARSQTSDNVLGIKVFRDRVWVFGGVTSEVYYDSGDLLNPFVPYPGSVMQEGTINQTSITVQGESVYWVAQDSIGQNRMVSAVDYAPTVISTPPISFALAAFATTTDCEALAYEQEGHPFIAWTFPTGDQTWVWDAREQTWHQRASFNLSTSTYHRWRARGLATANGLLLTGDYATGLLCVLDMDTFVDEDERVIKRARRAPYLSQENQWMFIDQIELGLQPGVGLSSGQGSAPAAMLSLSKDAGASWTPPINAGLGAMGANLARAIWRKLGRVRADRLVIEITQTDPVRCVWGPGLWIRATAGSGQL